MHPCPTRYGGKPWMFPLAKHYVRSQKKIAQNIYLRWSVITGVHFVKRFNAGVVKSSITTTKSIRSGPYNLKSVANNTLHFLIQDHGDHYINNQFCDIKPVFFWFKKNLLKSVIFIRYFSVINLMDNKIVAK